MVVGVLTLQTLMCRMCVPVYVSTATSRYCCFQRACSVRVTCVCHVCVPVYWFYRVCIHLATHCCCQWVVCIMYFCVSTATANRVCVPSVILVCCCVVCVYQRVLVTAVPICFYYCQRACRVCVPWGVQVYNYYHSCHRMCTHFATAAYTNMHIFLVCPK